MMDQLHGSDFPAFFQALHGYPALAWQTRLAALACEGAWPTLIDLPTGAGKTSCLDIATFALAVQADRAPQDRTAPLRTFLVVDRRIVVDDAFHRALKIRDSLAGARDDDSVLGRVTRRLLSLQGDDSEVATRQPIEAVQLRGGIYRDRSWVRSLTQPLLVTSTVDQVGSRMLFRGYGVSQSSRPVHAALVACDSLLLLDEAHCSKAFGQTISAVSSYQRAPWVRVPVSPSLVAVEMTATPSREVDDNLRFGLTDAECNDRESLLGRRRFTSKIAEMRVCVKATGRKAQDALATELVEIATALLSEERRAIAVVVNRVATAKKAYELLHGALGKVRDPARTVELMIGRMRALDRNAQSDRLRRQIASDTAAEDRPKSPLFVVATQCIEVGADLDFDALVTEAAPLDALRQRFGRLNRTARKIEARGAVVIQAGNVKSEAELQELEAAGKTDDPVYGHALARTWNWLWDRAEQVGQARYLDFGIAAMDRIVRAGGTEVVRDVLSTRGADAPILLPAHLDLLCQTSPAPWPDPDVSLWLHGPRRSSAEVNFCWRDDLYFPSESQMTDSGEARRREAQWLQAISLCPPSSIECMPVPLSAARQWLTDAPKSNLDSADVSGAETTDELDEFQVPADRQPVVWRGLSESRLLIDVRDLRPGDTLVLPALSGGWAQLGFIPGAEDPAISGRDLSPDDLACVDIAEQAYEEMHCRRLVRMFGSAVHAVPDTDDFRRLKQYLNSPDESLTKSELRELVAGMAASESDLKAVAWRKLQEIVSGRFRLDRYAVGQPGLVVTSLVKSDSPWGWVDDGDDDLSERGDQQRVSLADHLKDVENHTLALCSRLPLNDFREALLTAARMHDWGKCDPRFQAMLIRGDLNAAWRQPRLWAKSDRTSSSRADWAAVRRRARLPAGFRHEMLSMQLAELVLREAGDETVDLILHLIASHHGYARPWAPVSHDDESMDIEYSECETPLRLTAVWRLQHPPERIDSGVAERFWTATRRLGWWGAAYLETVLRLADQTASATPSRTVEIVDYVEEALT